MIEGEQLAAWCLSPNPSAALVRGLSTPARSSSTGRGTGAWVISFLSSFLAETHCASRPDCFAYCLAADGDLSVSFTLVRPGARRLLTAGVHRWVSQGMQSRASKSASVDLHLWVFGQAGAACRSTRSVRWWLDFVSFGWCSR